MHIVAKVANAPNTHAVQVATDGTAHPLAIAPKPSGFGSSVNGGELLWLALATCYCKGEISEETFEEWNRSTGSARLPERVRPEGRGKNTRRKPSARPRKPGTAKAKWTKIARAKSKSKGRRRQS